MAVAVTVAAAAVAVALAVVACVTSMALPLVAMMINVMRMLSIGCVAQAGWLRVRPLSEGRRLGIANSHRSAFLLATAPLTKSLVTRPRNQSSPMRLTSRVLELQRRQTLFVHRPSRFLYINFRRLPCYSGCHWKAAALPFSLSGSTCCSPDRRALLKPRQGGECMAQGQEEKDLRVRLGSVGISEAFGRRGSHEARRHLGGPRLQDASRQSRRPPRAPSSSPGAPSRCGGPLVGHRSGWPLLVADA